MQGSFAVVCPDVAGLRKTTSPKNEIIDAFRRANASLSGRSRAAVAKSGTDEISTAPRRRLSVTAVKAKCFPEANLFRRGAIAIP
jgi:hypothetical protein